VTRLRLPGTRQVDPATRVREFARVQVRAGLASSDDVLADVVAAARDDGIDDATTFASQAVAEARDELSSEQHTWPATTDYERLQRVFDDLRTAGVVVLQGVDDHWSAADELERRDEAGERLRGIAWFTAPDVWHAIDHGMLEVNLWHGDTANVAPGDTLLDEALAAFAAEGLPAHFDEGRIEVAARWQRPV
jgi:hypothetical protein